MEQKDAQEILDWIKSELEAKDTRIKALESAMRQFRNRFSWMAINEEDELLIWADNTFKELLKQR